MRRFAFCLIVMAQIGLMVSCVASKPSDVAKTFINYWANQDIDHAVSLFSKRLIDSQGGITGTKTALANDLFSMKTISIESVKIEGEDTAGALAEVRVRVNFTAQPKNKPAQPFELLFKFKFVQENDVWKIDFVNADEQRAGQGTKTQAPNTPTVQPTTSLNDEAVATVRDFWEQHTTRCGDSYFSEGDFAGTSQYKDVSFSARQTGPSTEADRLNGILWNGEVQIRNTAYRHKNNGSWSEWSQDRTMSQGWYNVGATKRSSGWSIVQLLAISEQRKVNCSEMTQQ